MATSRTLTSFLAALTAVVLILAGTAVLQSRLTPAPVIDLDGRWRIAHTVTWGPFKSWVFEYDVRLLEMPGGFSGRGETVAVNGRPPRAGERTSLDIVRGLDDGGALIGWFFERNGERAGRGALKWRVLDQDRLVGTFATTFYRGASVARRQAEKPPAAATE
jgi:hypothetical protein